MPNVDPKSSRDPSRLHDEVWKLLPWYSNGSLPVDDFRQVEGHLGSCELCREELARCAEIGVVVEAERDTDWRPSESDLDRLLHKIGASSEAQLEETPPRRQSPGFLDAIEARVPFSLGGWLVGPVMAAAALVFWFYGASLGGSPSLAPDPLGSEGLGAQFETLTSPGELSNEGPLIQLVLASGVSDSELRDLLLGIEGEVVSGPSDRGLYEIVVRRGRANRDGADAGIRRSSNFEINQAVALLREDRRVRFAAPILNDSTP